MLCCFKGGTESIDFTQNDNGGRIVVTRKFEATLSLGTTPPRKGRRVPNLPACSNCRKLKSGPFKTTCPSLQNFGRKGCFICKMLHQGLSACLRGCETTDNVVVVTPGSGKIPLIVEFEITNSTYGTKRLERKFIFYTPLGK